MNGDFLTRMQNIDRRVIYTVVFLVLLFPMFNPIGLPLKISLVTQKAFDAVDALPAGSLVMFTTANAPGTAAELEPQSIALMRHAINNKLRVVLNPTAAESPRFVDGYRQMFLKAGYVEGKDFLVLPYLAGGETLFGAMGSDLKSAYSMIAAGSSALWDSIDGMQDFDMLADCGGGESQLWALAHIEAKHKTPTICLITAVILAVRQPYFTSGQYKGIVSGLSGAAEYEVLARVPGKGASGMDAQSMGHLWVIFTILAGNIAYFITKGKKSSGGDR
ncbi:MAG: hypothetical protein Q8P31_13710 [Bacillota bacterium]|nr:hypothetical protein [Bacillota bacterium]